MRKGCSEEWNNVLIVGHVGSAQEAKEIEVVTKSFVVANRVRLLAAQSSKYYFFLFP